MGYAEYLAARETLGLIGQPVITYILFISLFLGIFSIIYLLKPIFVRFKAKSLSANHYIIESLFLVPLPILILSMIDII